MSSDTSSTSFVRSIRFIVSLSVLIGFTVLVIGGITFLVGLPLVGEALVLAGVFLFAFTLICWFAARRIQNR
ncbi:MAG: hypothetical protein ACFFD8_08740 [Candidatus Thorarchaeota archaeon]